MSRGRLSGRTNKLVQYMQGKIGTKILLNVSNDFQEQKTLSWFSLCNKNDGRTFSITFPSLGQQEIAPFGMRVPVFIFTKYVHPQHARRSNLGNSLHERSSLIRSMLCSVASSFVPCPRLFTGDMQFKRYACTNCRHGDRLLM